MDDLTRIKGVGPSTARALAAAGIDSFAALAAADAGDLMGHEAFRGLRAGRGDVAVWIAGAADFVFEPPKRGARGGGAEAQTPKAGGPTPPADPSGLVVFVRGPRRGRWRIGRFFGPEGRELSLDALSEDEKAQLLADSALTIETRPAT